MIECVSIFSRADNVREFIRFIMKKWDVYLYSGDTVLAKVNIKPRILLSNPFNICFMLNSQFSIKEGKGAYQYKNT